MRVRSRFGVLLVVLGVAFGATGALAKEKKADDKKADDKKAKDTKDKDKDKDKKADEKAAADAKDKKDKDKDKKADEKTAADAKDKKDKDKDKDKKDKDKSCSPTCTATCDCSGNPIAQTTQGDPKKAEEEKKKADAEKKKADEDAKKADEEKKKKADAEKKKADEDAKKAAEEVKKAEAKPLPAAPIDTLRKDRPDRRKVAVERLRRRWGSLVADAKAADDLKVHARRVAHLQRIRAIATSKKDKKTVEAVDELLTKEDERHSKAMNSLREGALPGTP